MLITFCNFVYPNSQSKHYCISSWDYMLNKLNEDMKLETPVAKIQTWKFHIKLNQHRFSKTSISHRWSCFKITAMSNVTTVSSGEQNSHMVSLSIHVTSWNWKCGVDFCTTMQQNLSFCRKQHQGGKHYLNMLKLFVFSQPAATENGK
jgi:hypothetical protein